MLSLSSQLTQKVYQLLIHSLYHTDKQKDKYYKDMNIFIVLILNVDKKCLTFLNFVCVCYRSCSLWTQDRGAGWWGSEIQNAKRLLLPRLQRTCLQGRISSSDPWPYRSTPSTLHPLFPPPTPDLQPEMLKGE